MYLLDIFCGHVGIEYPYVCPITRSLVEAKKFYGGFGETGGWQLLKKFLQNQLFSLLINIYWEYC